MPSQKEGNIKDKPRTVFFAPHFLGFLRSDLQWSCDVSLQTAVSSGESIWRSDQHFISAWALKRGFLTAKAGRPDVYRAANNLLRLSVDGRLCLCMRPPNYTAQKGIHIASFVRGRRQASTSVRFVQSLSVCVNTLQKMCNTARLGCQCFLPTCLFCHDFCELYQVLGLISCCICVFLLSPNDAFSPFCRLCGLCVSAPKCAATLFFSADWQLHPETSEIAKIQQQCKDEEQHSQSEEFSDTDSESKAESQTEGSQDSESNETITKNPFSLLADDD